MSSINDWATAMQAADILTRGHARANAQVEPSLLVQQIARNPILCGAATEYFSTEMPIWSPTTSEEDHLRPIDVLYGRYLPQSRSIDIFVRRIEQDASLFNAEPDELLEIVRLHEHAHAVVHLGSRADDVRCQLSVFDPRSTRTAWGAFCDERNSWFSSLPNELHELLAQALTYTALSHISADQRAVTLQRVFGSLEAKQPPHYRLSDEVKRCAAQADWGLVLDAARGVVSVCRGDDFDLAAGLAALICRPAEYCTGA